MSGRVAGWWDGGFRESFALLEFNQVLRFPDGLPDGADGAATGQHGGRRLVKAAFTGSPCHSPVAALSLSVHVWNDPAVRARHSDPAGGQCAVGQVLEALPRGRRAKHCAVCPGFWHNRLNGAIRRLPALFTVSLPESRHPCRGRGFRISTRGRKRKRGAMLLQFESVLLSFLS